MAASRQFTLVLLVDLGAPGTNAGQMTRQGHTYPQLPDMGAPWCGPAGEPQERPSADFCLHLFVFLPVWGVPKGTFLQEAGGPLGPMCVPGLTQGLLMFQALALAPASFSMGPRAQ